MGVGGTRWGPPRAGSATLTAGVTWTPVSCPPGTHLSSPPAADLWQASLAQCTCCSPLARPLVGRARASQSQCLPPCCRRPLCVWHSPLPVLSTSIQSCSPHAAHALPPFTLAPLKPSRWFQRKLLLLKAQLDKEGGWFSDNVDCLIHATPSFSWQRAQKQRTVIHARDSDSQPLKILWEGLNL